MFWKKQESKEKEVKAPFLFNLALWNGLNEQLKDKTLTEERRKELEAQGKEVQTIILKQMGMGALKVIAVGALVVVIVGGGLLVLGSMESDEEAEEIEDGEETPAIESEN